MININVGLTANDGTGDSLRQAFIYTNANFTELSATISVINNNINSTTSSIALINATFSNYSLVGHLHNQTDINGLTSSLATITSNIASATASIATKSALGHTHSNDTIMLNEGLRRRIQGYAISNEFISNSITSDFVGASILIGTINSPAAGGADPNHPGVVRIRNSASVNSGYFIGTVNSTIGFGPGITPGLECNLVFNPTTLSTNTFRFGLIQGTIDSNDATNGAYIEMSGAILSGKTANSGVRSQTSTNTTITSQWYHIRVKVITISQIGFYLYDDGGSLVWSDILTTNIPSQGTYLNICCIITNSSGVSGTELIRYDYIGVNLPAMTRGALN